MNSTDVESKIEKTVDLLLKCPKNQEPRLLGKLLSLWKKRDSAQNVRKKSTTKQKSSPEINYLTVSRGSVKSVGM